MSNIKDKYIVKETRETKISEFKNRKRLLEDLTREINSNYAKKLHSNLDNCYKDSIYNKNIKTIDNNGNKIVIIKTKKNIFKANGDFVTPERSRIYLDNNKYSLFWYSNKYMVYSLNSSIWGGINVLQVTSDIRLFDYFDEDNIKKLIAFIKETESNNSEKYIEIVRYITGYGLNIDEHKDLIRKMSGWDDIWTVDKVNTKHSLSYECDIDKNIGIRPVFYGVRYHYYLETVIMKNIYFKFLKKNNLDGFIKKSVYTPFADIDGIYHEEIILPGYTLLNKTIENKKHPLYWVNWNLDFKLPKNGLIMNSGLPSAYKNIYFSLAKFYLNNNKCEKNHYIKNNGTLSIFTYNVHSFVNINRDIQKKDNYFNINKLIKNVNADITLLQEVFIHPKLYNKYISKHKQRGRNIITSPNGLPSNKPPKLFIANISKMKMDAINKIDVTVYKYTRTCILSTIKDIKVAHVHLEVGYPTYRYLEGSTIYKNMEKINVDMRTEQLKEILEYDPDVIVGDFNFSYNDEESNFLNKRGYINSDDTSSTNPYNTRTDMCFYKKDKIAITNVRTIKCNYSDHNPVIYNVTKKI